MGVTLPKQGFVFWPVGCGDSTTVVIDLDTIMQIDLHHLECADGDDDPRLPILDRLIPLLPKRNGKPYLALFVLTHPDKDHCLGFGELLKRATIGELWFSPRVFWEHEGDLCEDAQAFCDEAMRRVKKTVKNNGKVESGDRIRVIGYADVLAEKDDYKDLPPDRITVPGNAVTEVDSKDRKDAFRAFIHAPFKDDAAGERNETSIAMQVAVKNKTADGKAMTFGDLSYPTLRRIFDESKKNKRDGDIAWDLFLAPHHCSKSAMYWKGLDDADETLKQDILDDIEDAGGTIGYMISSSDPIPASNTPGDNPPHAKAAKHYREIAPTDFLCTGEHPNEQDPQPIIFEVDEECLKYRESKSVAKAASGLAAAVAAARGSDAPPRDRVGFGRD